mgnify:FL=1
MKEPSKKILHYAVLLTVISVLTGFALGSGLSNHEEKQPVLFYYADNDSGDLSGIIFDKKVYTVIDQNGNHYIVTKDTYDNARKGNPLSSIVK